MLSNTHGLPQKFKKNKTKQNKQTIGKRKFVQKAKKATRNENRRRTLSHYGIEYATNNLTNPNIDLYKSMNL